MDDMDWELIKILIGVGLAFVLLTGACFGVAQGYNYYACEQFSQFNPSYNFHWGFWTGCLVQLPNGFYIDTSRIQFVNGELIVDNK